MSISTSQVSECPRVGLAGDGQRAVTTLLWIDGSLGRGDPRGYTVTGTVRPPPTDSRGWVGREVRIVDEISFEIEPGAEKRGSVRGGLVPYLSSSGH